ncbi:MAG TPA: hypothetical protein PKN36_04320 [bacterium]|nr:hypothetical protein [bacterium]
MRNRHGITFISLIIAVFVMAVGIASLLKVFPVISRLSERGKNDISVSLIADRIFTLIEHVYGDVNGPPVPSSIFGTDAEFPRYSYTADIEEEKENIYKIDVTISWEKEGKVENEYFFGNFRRK